MSLRGKGEAEPRLLRERESGKKGCNEEKEGDERFHSTLLSEF
jgi:hypothetical protein